MPVDVLLGLQWGDEGKGKVVDVFTPKYDIVARFQGGPNAGHTLEFNGEKHVLNTIPSGIFNDHVINIIGNGVVIDPNTLAGEIDNLLKFNVPVFDQKRLKVSKRAHLILPTHKFLDAASEKVMGDGKIGSTLRGISPTYQDKIGRRGLRVGDILSKDFKKKYQELTQRHLKLLGQMNFEDFNLKEAEEKWFAGVETLNRLALIDGEHYINQAINNDKNVLAEGAQGTLLDIDFGSYPFVTSSNTITAGACNGLGIAPNKIEKVIGIFKAYCTRVGSGPFPTELNDEVGQRIGEKGHEFGATTGRKRRCGWLDLPALKYAIMLNGVTDMVMTKADVLSGFDEIKVGTGYEIGGKSYDYMPYDLCEEDAKPILKSIKGWHDDITGVRETSDLPEEVLSYMEYLVSELGVDIDYLSVGPDREQIIDVNA